MTAQLARVYYEAMFFWQVDSEEGYNTYPKILNMKKLPGEISNIHIYVYSK